MNNEKKYIEILDNASVMHKAGNKDVKQILEQLFPELKESEDERIRKELINLVKSHSEFYGNDWKIGDFTEEQVFDWLEKQGKLMKALQISNSRIAELVEEKYNLEEKLEKQGEKKEINLVDILKHYPIETELFSPLYGKLWLAEVNEKNEIITCYKYPLYKGCVRAILEQEDTVSFYSNGTTGLPDFSISKDCMLFLYDKEKQGEKKSIDDLTQQEAMDIAVAKCFEQGDPNADKVEPKFKVGDVIRLKDGDGLEWTVENVHKNGYYTIVNSDRDDFIYLDDNCNWEIINQKVEPKFKVGQWIVWQDKCYKVNDNGCGYELVDQNGLNTSLEYGTIDENAHLWTIQDAQEGDVLVMQKTNITYESIFIFNKIENNRIIQYLHYFTTDAGEEVCEARSIGSFLGFVGTTVHPATKEQRELLFQKMYEAEYAFDFEKKELKKIVDEKQIKKNLQDNSFRRMFEQKPAWSEEDKEKLEMIIDAAESHCFLTLDDIDWLKSLKDRVQPQLKQEWSEEDEKMIDNIIDYMKPMPIFFESTTGKSGKEYTKEFVKNAINWLKSLRRQNTWKPSDWQMEAIKDAIKHYNSLGYNASILKELLNDLKKLKA